MALAEETYADGRASLHENLLTYAAQRIVSQRTTAISEPRRFFVLFMGVFACVCASTSYVYNLFSGNLQEKFNLSQSDMATITTLAGILGLVVFPLASVYDYFGPQPLFLIGLVSFPLGAVLFGLAFADRIDGSVMRFTLFNSLLGIGSGMFDIAGLMTVMSIFPSSRGAVIAVMKTFIGLGSAIFSAMQLGFFENNVTGFFFFMAAFVAVVSVLCAVFIQLPPYQLTGYEEAHLSDEARKSREQTKRAYFEQVPPVRRFKVGFAIVGILIVFLPVQGTLVAYIHLSHAYRVAFAVATCVLLGLYGVSALPLRFLDGGSEAIADRLRSGGDAESTASTPTGSAANYPDGTVSITPQALLRASQRVSAIIASTRGSIAEAAVFTMPVVDESQHIAPQYQTSFRESVCTPQLWALSYSIFCIVGAQMVIILNARFIYAAVAEEPISPALVALLTVVNGVGSALGRILMSIVEIWTQKREPSERIPLTIALFIPTTLMLISCLLLLVVNRDFLLVPFVFTALGNGFTAATLVLVMRTLYAKEIAMHYNFTSLASIAASIVFNKFLYGGWYTHMAQKQATKLCVGRQCVFLPFAIMGFLVLSSFVSNAYVHAKYSTYCRVVLEERGYLTTTHSGVPRGPNQRRGSSEQEPLLE